GDPCVAELLGRVRQAALGAYAHQDVPFDKIVEAVQPGRDLHHTPLFQVLFGLRDQPVQAHELGRTRFHMLETHTGSAKFELTMDIIEEGDEWTASLEYETDVFERPTVQCMLAHYVQLLRAMV